MTTVDYVLKNGDNVSHELTRRESPVIHQEIQIISMTDDLLVVNKPCSIPVHPTGRYNLNSMIKILEYDLGIVGLACLNRIDLPVSGLVILTRNPGKVREKMHDELHKKAIQKIYLLKVCGAVPWNEYHCKAPLKAAQAKMPMTTVDHEVGKASETHFRKVCVTEDGKYTLLVCRPISGRRHQIRVHATYLGHPIYNDEQYIPKEMISDYPIVDSTN